MDATERVITEWVVDPSAGVRGLELAGATLQQFQKMVEQVNRAMPGLPLDAQFKIASEGIKRATVSARELETALKAVAVVPAAAPIITRDKVAELKILASQLQQSQVVADQFTGSIGRMNMALLSRASGRVGDNGRSFDAGLASLRNSGKASEEALKGSNRAVNLMRGSLVTLAAQSVQTSSAIGGLAQSALFFAGGSGAVIKVAASVLASVLAWELFTKSQREAAKAVDENRKALRALQDQQKGPLKLAQESFSSQLKEVERLRKALAELNALKASALADIGKVGSGDTFLEKMATLNELTREQAALVKNLAAAQEELGFARVAVDAPGRDLIKSLERELAVLELGEVGVRRLEIAFGGLNEAITADALALLKQIELLERQKEAAEAAARALEEMLRSQHAMRVANAGGGNLTQGAGGTNRGPLTGGLLPGTSREEITLSREAAAIADADAALQGLFKTAFAGFRLLSQMENTSIKQHEDMARSLTDMGTAAFGIADVGHSLGIIGDEAAQAISDVGSLADALAQVALSASTANIFGALTAGASLLGGLIGGGPSETTRLLAENNQRLADLKASLDQSINTLAGLTASREQLDALRATTSIVNTKGGQRQVLDVAEIERSLDAAGMTIEEWAARIERQTGLDVLNDKGQIIAATLSQVDIAFKLLIEDAERFAAAEAEREAQQAVEDAAREAAQALRDVAAAAAQAAFAYLDALPGLLALSSQLGGTSDDVITQFQNMVQALHGWAPALADSFANMNLNDPAVREALRQRLLDYVNQIIQSGGTLPGLTPEATQAFIDFIGQGADVLDTFNESVDDATEALKSLTNVPRGLNLALLEFQTQALGPRLSQEELPQRFRREAAPFRGTDGAAAPTVAQTIGTILVNIYQQPGEDSEALTRRVVRTLELRNLAKTGDPLRAG